MTSCALMEHETVISLFLGDLIRLTTATEDVVLRVYMSVKVILTIITKHHVLEELAVKLDLK